MVRTAKVRGLVHVAERI